MHNYQSPITKPNAPIHQNGINVGWTAQVLNGNCIGQGHELKGFFKTGPCELLIRALGNNMPILYLIRKFTSPNLSKFLA